jgi:hypothetical protein
MLEFVPVQQNILCRVTGLTLLSEIVEPSILRQLVTAQHPLSVVRQTCESIRD